ncbi:MAG: hypothetical protein AAGL66_16810, partial [Pseudomonadota bacterium]
HLGRGGAPGYYLREVLAREPIERLDEHALIEALVQTKKPQIYAESEVRGDGSDWNAAELSILGDISFAVPVSVFDNGLHTYPAIHDTPFAATLLYVPGALLRNDRGGVPADQDEVVSNGGINREAYYRLYERRLLPALLFANQQCERNNTRALITIPGLGCGQFAGRFKGQLGDLLAHTIGMLLQVHHSQLPFIDVVYYDPHRESGNARRQIGHMNYLVRPLAQGNQDKPQLCRPPQYEEPGDNFSELSLFSLVAWDHVSWPGNDFYLGSRATDDGVKAAATSSMLSMTGIEGQYDAARFGYAQPLEYDSWRDAIHKSGIRLSTKGRVSIFGR